MYRAGVSDALAPPFPLAGELSALGAAMIWSISTTIYARHGRVFSSAFLNLFKNVVALVLLTIVIVTLALPLPRFATEADTYFWLAASGVVGLALGDTGLFAALRRLGAQLTTSIQCLSPPISALIAAIFLHESMTTPELVGMLVTAGAVAGIVYFRDQTSLDAPAGKVLLGGIVFALISATCQGAQVVMQRHALLSGVHVIVGTALRIGPALLVLLAMNAPKLRAEPPATVVKKPWAFLFVAAFLGTFLGLILASVGAKYAKAGVAAALTSTYPVWVMPIARVYLNERIGWPRAACTVLAVCGIIILVF